MDRLAQLIQDAENLRRRLWASLPWQTRLANIMNVLADGSSDPFNRTFAAMFLVAGVQSMPDIRGVHYKAPDGSQQEYPHNADEFAKKFREVNGHKGWHDQVRLLSGILPRGYASVIGGSAFKASIAVTKSRNDSEDVLHLLVENYYGKGAGQRIEPVHFQQAVGLVAKSAKNLSLNLIAQRHRKDVSLDEDEGAPIVKAPTRGPESVEDMAHAYVHNMLQEIKKPEVRRDLDKVHPDAVRYIELLADGYDDKEIVGDYRFGLPSMLPHLDQSSSETGMTIQNWGMSKKPKIFKILKKYIGDSPL